MRTSRLIAASLIALTTLAASLPALHGGLSTARANAEPLVNETVSLDTGYRPSIDGYQFKNSFSTPDDNWLVKLGGGRCGGMAYASLDRFHERTDPGTKSGDGALIARRNIDSLVGNGSRFVLWTAWSSVTAGRTSGIEDLTRREELPLLAAALERGPVPLGLVRTQRLAEMKRNHQVVAYAMRSDGVTARIWIYDPNHPQADDVVLEVPLDGGPIVSKRGTAGYAAWQGLFVERYAPAPAATPVTEG